jgi:hypothetical protein
LDPMGAGVEGCAQGGPPIGCVQGVNLHIIPFISYKFKDDTLML